MSILIDNMSILIYNIHEERIFEKKNQGDKR